MSEDAQAGKSAAPITQEMLESLAADYKAGRLPDDVKERIDALRDEYFENFKDRMVDLKNDAKPGIDEFISDVKAQMSAYEADGGTLNSEVVDSRMLQISANVVDAGLEKVVQPVIDAVEDVVHDTIDYASELVQIRAEHDPDGIHASRLEAAQEELARSGEIFDAGMEKVHGDFDTVHEQMEQLRAEAEEFHQDHAPVQIIKSTTVDPNLPEQMAEETGEGAA
ncbi:MAG: hypothetical protein IPH71_03695 [Proteobacteria bacterium]|jgi:uncharacterized protein YnzC (UPF0291/DUF896 family)|nr:hypothetical protein [Pseudomonadota bacterium]MCC6633564.1 hypothetical protein [Gammaproteobacteria bacterium]